MIRVDPRSAVSPVQQIQSQLAAQIRSGNLEPDSRLPTVRQLAADLRVAPGSVAKAYKELESAGLIRTARAAGTRVNPGQTTTKPLVREPKNSPIKQPMRASHWKKRRASSRTPGRRRTTNARKDV